MPAITNNREAQYRTIKSLPDSHLKLKPSCEHAKIVCDPLARQGGASLVFMRPTATRGPDNAAQILFRKIVGDVGAAPVTQVEMRFRRLLADLS